MRLAPNIRFLLLGALPTFILLTAALAGPRVQQPPKVDYLRDIQPMLKASCCQCHGVDKQEAGLRLDLRDSALKGGVSGCAIEPGHADRSLILDRVLGKGGKPRMPYGFAPLTRSQIALLRSWIDQGAIWPTGKALAKHWAYVKPVLPAVPQPASPRTKGAFDGRSWVRNPIDNFVLARMRAEGLTPSSPAPPAILLRRVYLDLVGLPPSPKEVDAYLADRSPNAYEKVVDRLLASPHFGERWARPWLDLARYADSNGYEKDNRRSIWPYRDWVIDAINRDMPYDEFTIEQIAGDLLPKATMSQKIATGFNRNTMQNEEGGVDQGEQRWLTEVDRVGTLGSVWLGTTTACTECHNHKYDPFTQKEFYQLLAFFDHTDEPTLEVAPPDQLAKRAALQLQIGIAEKAAKAAPMDTAGAARLADLKKQVGQIDVPTTLVMQEKTDNQIPSTNIRIKGAYLSKGELVQAGTPAVLNPFRPEWPRNRLGLAYWLVDRNNPLTARVEVNRLWEQLFGRGIVETSEDFGTQGQRPTHPKLLDWLACSFIAKDEGSSSFSCAWSTKKMLRLMVTSATYRQSSVSTPRLEEIDPANRLLARGPSFRMEAEMIRDSALAAGGLLSPKVGGPSVFPLQPAGIWNIPYNGDQWVTSTGEDRYRRGLYTFWRRSAPYPEFLSFDATSREYCTVRRIRTDTPLQALTTLNDPAFFEAAQGLAARMQREGGDSPTAQIAYGFRCCVARRPTARELARLTALYGQQLRNYMADPKSAQKITSAGGDAGAPPAKPHVALASLSSPQAQPSLPATDAAARARTAALTIVANVMLNMDETLTKE